MLDDIKKAGGGAYVALCSDLSKDEEPYKGARRGALTNSATGEKPTAGELKNDFGWKHVPLKDFSYNEEASHCEKTLHTKLQYHLRGQKLWMVNGAGGGDPGSTHVALCYGPLTGLVRDPKCDKVYD